MFCAGFRVSGPSLVGDQESKWFWVCLLFFSGLGVLGLQRVPGEVKLRVWGFEGSMLVDQGDSRFGAGCRVRGVF